MIGTYFADMLAAMLKNTGVIRRTGTSERFELWFVASGETLAPVRRFGLGAARETEDAGENGDEPEVALLYLSS